MPPSGQRADITDAQVELRRRMVAIARWLKHRYNYRGSKETMDFVARGFEKLVAAEPTASKVRENPRELLQLSGRLMRQVLIDELRARRALRRGGDKRTVPLTEQRVGAEPSVERRIDEARRFALVESALTRIERGELPFRFSRPAHMVAAFRLKFSGVPETTIASELGVAKGTVHNWVKHVTAFLARHVARQELVEE